MDAVRSLTAADKVIGKRGRGSGDKSIKIFDIKSLNELKTLNGHSNIVLSVAFSPDG